MLYHSFPQHCNFKFPDMDIDILKNILKYGLLLTPEIIEYPGKTDENGIKKGKDIKLLQCRFCMTAIQDSEINEKLKIHSQLYGDFHLEFTNEDAYLIGAMPMMHVPKAPLSVQKKPASLWNLASSFVHLLDDFKNIADMLEYLDNACNDFANEKEITLTSDTGRSKEVNVEQLRNILALLLEGIVDAPDAGQRKKEFERIQGAIQGLCSLFYFTDNLKENGKYEYLHHFWVHEWRIIQGMCVKGIRQDRELTEEERNATVSIAPNYFNSELDIEINGGKLHVIDLCRILPEISGEPVQNFINKIYVPSDRYDKTIEVLTKKKLPVKKIVSYDREKGIKN